MTTEEILRKLNGLPSNAAARVIEQIQIDAAQAGRDQAIAILKSLHQQSIDASAGTQSVDISQFDDGWTQACEFAIQRLQLFPGAQRDPVDVEKEQSSEGIPGPSVKIPMPKRDAVWLMIIADNTSKEENPDGKH